MIRDKIAAVEDVLDDVTLQFLSATCPQGRDALTMANVYLSPVCRQIISHSSKT